MQILITFAHICSLNMVRSFNFARNINRLTENKILKIQLFHSYWLCWYFTSCENTRSVTKTVIRCRIKRRTLTFVQQVCKTTLLVLFFFKRSIVAEKFRITRLVLSLSHTCMLLKHTSGMCAKWIASFVCPKFFSDC